MKKGMKKALASLVIMGMISGCSSNETSGENENGNNQDVKIEFWSWLPKSPFWPDIEKDFEAKYPGIDIEYVFTDNKPDYEQKLKVAMASGQGPDIIGTQYGALMNSFMEKLEPLEPLAKEEWGDSWKDNFKAGALTRIDQYEGVPALPAGLVSVPLVQYDADMFEKVGVDIPTTYDELKEVLRKFKEANLDGVMPHVGFGGGEWGPQVRALYYNLANQVAPNKLYQADAGEIPFTDPDLVKAASLMKEYADDEIFQPGFLSNKLYPDVYDELLINKKAVPMIIMGSWGTFNWVKRADYKIEDRKFGFFPVPAHEGYNSNVQVDVDLALAIPKSSKEKEAAWKFVKYMTLEGYQDSLQETMVNIPGAKGKELSKEALTVQTEKASLDVITEGINNPVGVRALENPEIESALFKNLQSMLAGDLTPKEAMENVQDAASKIKR